MCLAHKQVVVVPLFDSVETAEQPLAQRIVFLTKATFSGDLGGPEGADEKCQAEADADDSLVKGKAFKAWVSFNILPDFSNNAESRTFVRSTNPYLLVNGVQIATDFTDLTNGSITAPIQLNANGDVVTGSFIEVWTGIEEDGIFPGEDDPDFPSITVSNNCSNWTVGSQDQNGLGGLVGPRNIDSTWTNAIRSSCNARYRLYCFEQ